MPQKGTLYLLPTVLSEGRFETIPSVVIKTIQQLDYFLVENIRTSRRYISGLQTGLSIESLQFEVVDKNTPPETIEKYLKPVLEGRSAGVMSESGCPGIADPGARLASWAHNHGIKVVPHPGPSSIFLALMASGMNGQQFAFRGYLPIDKKDRAHSLKQLEAESAKHRQTQIFIETPYRNEQMLKTILETCSGNTLLCVAREWIKTAPVKAWQNETVSLHKVPVVFLLLAGVNF